MAEDIFSSDTLLIRHLPLALSVVEKEELLQHFGAVRVKVMGSRGPMKHTAFATFRDKKATEKALSRLHQLEILSCRLIVEYANKKQQRHFPTSLDEKRKESVKKEKNKDDAADTKTDQTESKTLPEDVVYKKWCLDYPRNPKLYYVYPPPTVSIIANISNTLASYPKFYVQVLHLMNKMNLPAPFGSVTCAPLIPDDSAAAMLGEDILRQEEMDVSSEEESEIESDGDMEKVPSEKPAVKRAIRRKSKLPHKRPKIVPLFKQPENFDKFISQGPTFSTQEVFEQNPSQVAQKKIQLRIPDAVVAAQTRTEPPVPQDYIASQQETVQREIPTMLSVADSESTVEAVGFGKFEPTEKPQEEKMQESDLPYTVDPNLFLTREQLKKGRIAERELKNFSVFKNYKSGEKTSRLYIKNLAKQTSEQDLVNIFGQYIDWSAELERNMFDIRLMKEGRMKGQAFITFPSDEAAAKALQDSNSYVLHSKPMAVQFARSAKAKEVVETKGTKK